MRTATALLAVLTTAAAAAAFGFPQPPGWKPVGEAASFGPDNLWEQVDGAADLFLAYGFRQLQVQEMESGGVRVAVNVYELGSPLDAFGVLTVEGGSEPILPVAAGAVVSPPYQCLLAKDRFYVKVETTAGELSAGLGEALVAGLAAALSGHDGPPAELALLPAGRIVPGSVRYARQGFLGLSELSSCLHAKLTGSEAQVFVVVPGDKLSVDGIWQALAAKWVAVEHPGRPILARKVPYHGLVGVIRSSSGILGVTDAASKEELATTLEGLAR